MNRKTITVLYLIFMLSPTSGQASLDDAYRDGLSIAQANMQKSADSIQNLNPAEAFKDKDGKSKYTESPSEMGYHQGITQGNKEELDAAGRAGIDQNEATKEVWNSFKNPKIKIDPGEPWLSKSNDIIKNAANIVTSTSSKPGAIVKNGESAGVNCTESKICRVELVKKMCNEEANPLKKICEKVPKTATSIKDNVYPGCKSVVVTQGVENGCPGGYSQILYADMLWRQTNDDIRICTKSVAVGEGLECFGGYMVYELDRYRVLTTERATVPKKLHGRIKFSNVYHGAMNITIINETTGVTLYDDVRFTNGQVIELPFSEKQDQTFRFYRPRRSGGGFFGGHFVGVMVLYIDHISREKVANLESWLETNCSES